MISKVYDDGSTAVYAQPIADGAASRRAREQSAVLELIRYAIGPEAELLHTPDGAPYVPGGPFVSVSHSLRWAVLAVSDHRVGVDVEQWRDQLVRVAPRVLSPEELECYAERLLEAWTLKEALFKCAGLAEIDFAHDVHLPAAGESECSVRDVRCKVLVQIELQDALISLVEAL